MCNVGVVDQVARFFIGIVALILAPILGSWIVGAVGVILTATSVFGFCPAYLLGRISTCKSK